MRAHLTVNPWRILITCIQGNAWVKSLFQLLRIAATSQPAMRCGGHPSINSTAINTRIKIKPSNSNTPQPLVMAGCVEDVTCFRCACAGHMNGQPSQGRTVAKTLKNCNRFALDISLQSNRARGHAGSPPAVQDHHRRTSPAARGHSRRTF
jgi:hypothetical protein